MVSVGLDEKTQKALAALENCCMCPRDCGVRYMLRHYTLSARAFLLRAVAQGKVRARAATLVRRPEEIVESRPQESPRSLYFLFSIALLLCAARPHGQPRASVIAIPNFS